MRLLRRRLPVGIAAVEFCAKHIVIVNSQLSEQNACKASAMARTRCNGVFAIVKMWELAEAA
jgi:hypothetical protein